MVEILSFVYFKFDFSLKKFDTYTNEYIEKKKRKKF